MSKINGLITLEQAVTEAEEAAARLAVDQEEARLAALPPVEQLLARVLKATQSLTNPDDKLRQTLISVFGSLSPKDQMAALVELVELAKSNNATMPTLFTDLFASMDDANEKPRALVALINESELGPKLWMWVTRGQSFCGPFMETLARAAVIDAKAVEKLLHTVPEYVQQYAMSELRQVAELEMNAVDTARAALSSAEEQWLGNSRELDTQLTRDKNWLAHLKERATALGTISPELVVHAEEDVQASEAGARHYVDEANAALEPYRRSLCTALECLVARLAECGRQRS